jgi:hypothetical protein
VVQKNIPYLNNSFKPKSINMKKLFFILAVVILNSLIACNSDAGGMSATAKKNKEVNEAITKAYEAGDLAKWVIILQQMQWIMAVRLAK